MLCLLLLTVIGHEMVALLGTTIYMADAPWRRDSPWGGELAFLEPRSAVLVLWGSWRSSPPLSKTLATLETTCLSLDLSLPLLLLASQNLPGLQTRASSPTCPRERWRWPSQPDSVLWRIRDNVCKCLARSRYSVSENSYYFRFIYHPSF